MAVYIGNGVEVTRDVGPSSRSYPSASMNGAANQNRRTTLGPHELICILVGTRRLLRRYDVSVTCQPSVAREAREGGGGECEKERECVCERLEIDGRRVGEEEMREGGI